MVKKKDRHEGELDVIIKAKELAQHTIRTTNNDKYFPKRYRLTIVDRMVEKAVDIFTLLYEANEIYPRNAQERTLRQMNQRKAMAYCRSLIALVDICKELFGLPDDKVRYWSGLTFAVRNQTVAWFNKDLERFKSLQ